jgi:hypothetical protein
MGKSFAQLLTSRAVLIAAGLAAVGGGRGWMFCSGAVDARRRGGAGRGGGPVDVPWGGGERSVGEATSLYELGVGVGQSRLAEWLAGFWVCGFIGTPDGEGCVVGVGGPEGRRVASPVDFLLGLVLALLLLSGPLYLRDFGTKIEAKRRTVRWCARVAAAFKLRKKRYWIMIGARDRKVVARDGSFSMRAQVK